MDDLVTRPLGPDTWEAYAALIDANKGIWGGCWCLAYHGVGKGGTYEERREMKHRRVDAGAAHAALVFDGAACVGWAQFGRSVELPRVPNAKRYAAADSVLPEWRMPCFFVAGSHRRRGVAKQALAGALDLIAEAGGGVVEAFPETTEGRKASSSFLWHGTTAMFEQAGFTPVRQIGKHRWVMRRTVEGART